MKILVTGGTGFIGTQLVKKLRELEHEVRTVGRSRISNKQYRLNDNDLQTCFIPPDQHYSIDLSRDVMVRRMFAHWQPEVIFHLAGNPNTKLDEISPSSIIDDNVKATQNIVHWCPKTCHVLFASTILVYGEPDSISHEGQLVCHLPSEEFDEKNPVSLYGVTKLASEHIIQVYKTYKGEDFRYKIIRLCATVGPGLTHGVIKDFIHKARNNNQLEMLGGYPGSRKPYIHVDDVISAFLYLMDLETDEILNVCPDDNITIDKLADIVLEEMQIGKEKVWLGDKANWKGDSSVLCATPRQALKRGITIKYTSANAIRKAVRENL